MLHEILLSGYIPRNINILRAELLVGHAVRRRRFVIDFIPSNSIGAELGVYTGLFSSILAKQLKISQVTFVDPWWKAFGDRYPNWGPYTDYGRVNTRDAFELAERRILRSGLPNRHVEVCSSYDWLTGQADKSLDWVYLDSTHSYEGTKRELELLDRKIKDGGMILGDDWEIDRNHPHYGVTLAVNEFLKSGNFELILCGMYHQWILRSLGHSSTLPIQSTGPVS
jgi:hypothetical protein